MHGGGGGPSGPVQGRDILELIPGRYKTVWFDQPPINYAVGGLLFLVVGIGLSWGVLLMFQDAFSKHEWVGVGLSVLVGGALAGLVTFAGGVSLYAAMDSSRCLTLQALSQRLNVTEDALIQATREKRIFARYDIMGRYVFRAGDFDSLHLLRASAPPVKPDELLRAGSKSPTPSNLLLRGSNAPDASAKADGTESNLTADGVTR